jgi:hypothetical protein
VRNHRNVGAQASSTINERKNAFTLRQKSFFEPSERLLRYFCSRSGLRNWLHKLVGGEEVFMGLWGYGVMHYYLKNSTHVANMR